MVMEVPSEYEDCVRARPGTSLAHPKYCQEPIVWPTVGLPVQDGSGPAEVDEAEELVLLLDEVEVVGMEEELVVTAPFSLAI
jgi:hypothetical protein